MRRKWGLCLFAVLAGVALAFLGATPPKAAKPDAPLGEFSSVRAMEDVRIVAAEPHVTGSDANKIVANYLTKRIEADLGLNFIRSEFALSERSVGRLNQWMGTERESETGVNLMGFLPGDGGPDDAVLLMAHYDSVPGSPGAADDAMGVAAILEILRAAKTIEGRKRDLYVLFTDAEEIGLDGARNFFEKDPYADTIGAVINFEARGAGGTANMFQTSAMNGEAVRLYAREVRQPSASSLSVFVYNMLPNDTDLTPALKRDYTAFNIANIGDAEYYHSPLITPDALSEKTLQHLGSQGLDLTRALLTADTLPAKAPDATFFDLFGFFTIIYMPWFGWLFLLAGFAGYASITRRNFRIRPASISAAKMLGFVGLCGVILFALNRLSGEGGNYYDRLAAIHELEVIAILVFAAFFIAIFAGRKMPLDEQLGIAIPIFALGVAGQVLAPTATYFLPLAIFLSGASLFLLMNWPEALWAKIGVAIMSALIFGYMITLGHLLMLGVGPDMLWVAAVPAAIAVLALAPLMPGFSSRARRFVPAICMVLAIGAALYIRLDPIAVTVPAY